MSNDNAADIDRRGVLYGLGGLAAAPLSLGEWLGFGKEAPKAIVVDVREALADYDAADHDLFLASDTEEVFRPVDGEWVAWATSGETPVFGTVNNGSVDSAGLWRGGVVLPGVTLSETNAGTPGQVLWDEDRQSIAFDDGVDWGHPVLGDGAITASETVADTTAETVVYNNSLDSGSMVPGRVYETYVIGRYSTANTSDTFSFTFSIGGTDVSVTQSAGGNATDAPFQLKLEFTVRSDGAGGEIMPFTGAHFNDQPQDSPGGGPVAVDTTTVNNITGTVTWSAADPGNSVTVEQAYTKEVS